MGFWDEEESKKKEIMSLPFRQPYGMEHYFWWDGQKWEKPSSSNRIPWLTQNKPKEGAKGGKRFPYSQWRIVRRTDGLLSSQRHYKPSTSTQGFHSNHPEPSLPPSPTSCPFQNIPGPAGMWRWDGARRMWFLMVNCQGHKMQINRRSHHKM
jgi:hypothetical protein